MYRTVSVIGLFGGVAWYFVRQSLVQAGLLPLVIVGDMFVGFFFVLTLTGWNIIAFIYSFIVEDVLEGWLNIIEHAALKAAKATTKKKPTHPQIETRKLEDLYRDPDYIRFQIQRLQHLEQATKHKHRHNNETK